MRRFKVDITKTHYFSVGVTFMEDGKDEMDAVQMAMEILDYDEKPFFDKEVIAHEVEEIEWEE